MGCAEPLCYGRSVCTACNATLLLIKEGTRRRLTFFCAACQPPDLQLQYALERKQLKRHQKEIHVHLPLCRCKQLPAVQLMRRPGKNFGRVHAVCARRRNINQPGCAGQHRRVLHGPGCDFFTWLDEGQASIPLLQCACMQRMVRRRVMEITNNGCVFLRCALRRCDARVWLVPRQLQRRPVENHEVESTAAALGGGVSDVNSLPCDGQEREMPCHAADRRGRWRSSLKPEDRGADAADGGLPLERSEDKHGQGARDRAKRGRARKTPSVTWSWAPLRATDGEVSSDEPLTSGDEEDGAEEELAESLTSLSLLSLEASRERLASARSPAAPPTFEKRWKRQHLSSLGGIRPTT